MFRDIYQTEVYIQQRKRELEDEIKRQQLIRIARQGQRNLSQRVLSALGEQMLASGAALYYRYGDQCASKLALLDQLLTDRRPRPVG